MHQRGVVLDAGDAYQHFCSAFAVGDFNDEGRIDVAVGIPGWSNTEERSMIGVRRCLARRGLDAAGRRRAAGPLT